MTLNCLFIVNKASWIQKARFCLRFNYAKRYYYYILKFDANNGRGINSCASFKPP